MDTAPAIHGTLPVCHSVYKNLDVLPTENISRYCTVHCVEFTGQIDEAVGQHHVLLDTHECVPEFLAVHLHSLFPVP